MSELKPIVLVEDSAKDIELTLAAFEESNLANPVVVLRDGSEALEYLRNLVSVGSEVQPAVVLLDVKMPKVNGVEVLRNIKADPNLRNLPVVMLTSSRESPDVVECYELGANAYVVKPMGFSEFFEAVKTVGKFWAIVNEQPKVRRTGGEGCDGSISGG
jgi:CheY-like chemotaxis protein